MAKSSKYDFKTTLSTLMDDGKIHYRDIFIPVDNIIKIHEESLNVTGDPIERLDALLKGFELRLKVLIERYGHE